MGYQCTIITSDFEHRSKNKYTINSQFVKQVNVIPYKKNVSFSRLFSHIEFAKKAYNLTDHIQPDLIYIGSPPNSCAKIFSKYKRKHPSVKMVLAITDMWPETMPIPGKIKRIGSPTFALWKNIRNHSIKFYNGIIFECDLFKNYLSKYIKNRYSKTIYLSKKDTISICEKEQKREYHVFDELKLAYIGSINNIIDIDMIANIVKKLTQYRSVRVSIIGDGEKKAELIDKIKIAGATVDDYGIIYDDNQKYQILSSNHYGLNVMKNSVFVGATMKSLEYLYFGLPMLNNIAGDTKKIIKQFHCGFNLDYRTKDSVYKQIAVLPEEKYRRLVQHSQKVFLEFFSEKAILKKMRDFFETIEYNDASI
ncbi:MAG: glycosyltransferase family 4 protein [Ruminococcus flavefaciens]|nr:glycosyltransferase family 4 protein [Ruminococcus flavefaciens]